MKTRDILFKECYKVEKTRKNAKGKSDFPILRKLRLHRKDSVPKGCGGLHVNKLASIFPTVFASHNLQLHTKVDSISVN